VAPEDFEARTLLGVPAPPPPPVPSPPPPALEVLPPDRPRRATGGSTGTARRPATVNLLVALWGLFVPLSVAAALLTASRLGGGALAWGLAAVASLVLAGFGIVMALGLRALAPWARQLQVAAAGVGLLACPFTLASATVILYLARPEVKAVFEGRSLRPREENGTAEATYALSLVAMLLLGLALAAIAAFVI